jgi:heme oxygenase
MDYNKLLQGQIGVVTYFDIEKIKNLKTKERESYINTKSITKESKDQILDKFNGIARILQEMAADEEAT